MTTEDEVTLTYDEIVDFFRELGLSMNENEQIDLCTESNGSAGMQHRTLFSNDRVVFKIRRVRRDET